MRKPGKRADYVLRYRADLPIAIVEAKAEYKHPGAGLQQAFLVLDVLEATGEGRLTAQVLGEFFRATTRPIAPMLTLDQAQQQVDSFSLTWPVLDITAMVVQEAVRAVRVHRLSYYDAQVWAAARLNQIAVVFSEDFTDGRSVEGVRFVDPFAEAFSLEAWIG
ncbi:MAG: PIN domain-containing protein [Anaerolineales bacterium]|nr:PIN domain-containing protein [Anaerolineales bacterium]